MYFNVGANEHAWKLFHTMEHKDIASWNTILSVSSQAADVEQAVTLFSDFMVTGLKPNRITFSILFKMCGDIRKVDLGQQL
ncbi:putative tetratricopeptide-like helical domain superfamily [Helianthus annuus]|uniref:Tetratricopeptide-like helical domain superfamily n=1 Tax=Helianthus annuus TaxID=4232 RepID=A0A9K3GSX2_HELAN|nr:putative tetratricopeptide-like helical domain superfamily [Helianthus annuus]KAJ0432250.1 putative tetratricopeptide-like helical domain superfamily [Helianthus annuus]KAJ0631463.1 putative tetratricopeptide-like helical domain superfamily [Helianthus annuus]KAJ0812049.1 putative tetratricopeptide-like helical domain superfamily [Helianthus annuus]